jgi:hypothetical protein
MIPYPAKKKWYPMVLPVPMAKSDQCWRRKERQVNTLQQILGPAKTPLYYDVVLYGGRTTASRTPYIRTVLGILDKQNHTPKQSLE